MRSITRTCGPTLVEAPLPGDSGQTHKFWIESPTVAQALVLLDLMGGEESLKRVIDPGSEQAQRFRRVLRAWWTPRLASMLAREGTERQAVEVASLIVRERTQTERKAISEQQGTRTAADIDWPGVLSDYMATYGCTWREALAEPWGGFLLLTAKTGRQHARRWLGYLQAKSIPHIQNERDREAAVQRLRDRAEVGSAPDDTEISKTEISNKTMTAEEQYTKLDDMMARMGVA